MPNPTTVPPSAVQRGDRLVWRHELWPVPIRIEVTRVARDGTWADIDVSMCDAQWSRRTPLPLPSGCRPDNSDGELRPAYAVESGRFSRVASSSRTVA